MGPGSEKVELVSAEEGGWVMRSVASQAAAAARAIANAEEARKVRDQFWGKGDQLD